LADDHPTSARPIGVFDLTSLELGTMVATTTVPIGLTEFPKAQRRTDSFPKEGIWNGFHTGGLGPSTTTRIPVESMEMTARLGSRIDPGAPTPRRR
jgi:hypothetical protein